MRRSPCAPWHDSHLPRLCRSFTGYNIPSVVISLSLLVPWFVFPAFTASYKFSHLLCLDKAPLTLVNSNNNQRTFNIQHCTSQIHLPVVIMTVYDYLTPFEDQVPKQDHNSQERPFLRPAAEEQATKPSTSIDAQYFDAGPVFFSNPQPFTILPLTSELPPSHEDVPELSHRLSTSSTVSLGSSPCKSCGLIQGAQGLLPERDCCHICPDLARERECPDIHVPSKLEESQAQSRRPRGHLRKRHSLLCESVPLREELTAPEGHSNCHSHADHPLEEECGMLEQESNMLGREASPLEYETSPLGQAADEFEELDSAMSPCNTEAKAKQEERERHYQKAQRQLSTDHSGLSSPYSLHACGNQSNAQPDEVPHSRTRGVSFYGKCL
jgi:hypothetical protein